jgi:hypothetical protein
MRKRGRPILLSVGKTERVGLRMSTDQKRMLNELAYKREETLTELIFAGLALLLIHQSVKNQ